MIAVIKKFRPLVERSFLRFEQDVILLKSTQSAPPGGRVKWCSMLNKLPPDVILDITTYEGL